LETTDLSEDHPGILQKMVSAYNKWAQDTGIIEPPYSEQQRNLIAEAIAACNQAPETARYPMEQ
jgi:hypothetical protein